MTILELAAVLGGLVAGYWLVSVMLDWMAARRRGDSWQPHSTSGNPPGPERPATEPDRDNPANWARLLEVPDSASAEQISAAYRKKIAEYHPDKVAQMGAEIRGLAELRSKQINAAYDYAMKLRRRQGL